MRPTTKDYMYNDGGERVCMHGVAGFVPLTTPGICEVTFAPLSITLQSIQSPRSQAINASQAL